VSALPGAFGELHAVGLAEEILTPGDRQVRALVTVAGNPALSLPNSAQLQEALASLEFMVSVDIYINETTRYADVILPPPGPLQRPHYDIARYQLAVRNVGNYSPATFPLDPGQLEEWGIVARLALILQGAGADADPAILDDVIMAGIVEHAVADPRSLVHGRDRHEQLGALSPRRGPERMLDFQLRTGPYGDGFDSQTGGLSLDTLAEAPHGINKGPLVPRIPEVLRTPSGCIELAPAELVADVERLAAERDRFAVPDVIVLVGRRDLRSSDRRGDGCRNARGRQPPARVGSRRRRVEIQVARRHGGVNTNLLTDERRIDALSGIAALNGVPVTVTAL
jgi:hypothetical protein